MAKNKIIDIIKRVDNGANVVDIDDFSFATCIPKRDVLAIWNSLTKQKASEKEILNLIHTSMNLSENTCDQIIAIYFEL
jgi:hypothetical protein